MSAPPLPPAQESALRCLGEMAALHARTTSLDLIQREHNPGPEASPAAMVHAARGLGLRARAGRLGWEQLLGLGSAFPVLARTHEGHWLIVVGVVADAAEETVAVLDPLDPAGGDGLAPMTRDAFTARWSGEVIYVKRRLSLSDESQPFGLAWVATQALREKGVFRDVALAAVMSQIIGLGVPIYFQLVVDKVLAHHATSTLAVLTVGVLLAVLFDAGFTYLRRTLALHATTKIDMRLSLKTFAHLLSLPLPYFETTPTGVITRHMQQVEKIREFLTGRLFNTALDTVTLVVVIPVLFFYSAKLTLLVLGIAALMAAVVGALVGPFRKRLLALYTIEAKRQAMMVESVSGMRTIKSLAVEGPQVRKWEERSAEAVTGHYRVGMISAGAQAVIGGLEKLMMVVIVGVGAFDVFDGSLSVGALIAFNMLAGRITGPLVQMASLIQDWQETALSIRMLGEIMNHPPERPPGALGLCPPIRGGLQLDGVSFRYGPDLPPALDRINLTIPPGAVVGVVGRSGSGKTTLTRLVQGLFTAQDGVLRIDGVDIRQIDLAHLRRHIGVVLQENVLFEGTVLENIQMGRPGATAEEAVECGRLAGAEEFVERLPKGYETVLEENGANLSGGQRQRLAIARALIARPRLLILDEATSALDPESEAIVMDNLERIAQGRTLLIVSHRLNTLTECDSILVMERGRIVAAGRHADLLERSDTYRTLWSQQNRHAAARAAHRPPAPGGPGGGAR